jgi:hypothetical protein
MPFRILAIFLVFNKYFSAAAAAGWVVVAAIGAVVFVVRF